ncbi:MAG: CapA family protein [Oscillospiraceae bacterium]|nr:CapA family protein [Oscillospiraceae bacterium]
MKNILKYKLYVCIFIIAVIILNTVFISGCGIITKGSNLTSTEELSLSSDNYKRSDIYIDNTANAASAETQSVLNSFETAETLDTPGTPDTISAKERALQTSSSNNTNTEQSSYNTEQNSNTERSSVDTPDGTTRLSFIAAGDNIMHSNMIDDAKERATNGENFDFIDMYKGVADIIKSADIALVNVETPIAGDEFAYTGYPNFNTPKEDAFALMDIGFDIINTANNHMLDLKEKGYMNSINFWDSQKNYNGGDILQIGSFKDRDDFENIRIYRKDGISIAFLSYTYGTNGMVLPDGSKMIVPIIDDATVERQIKAARPLADLLFVVMHWGTEDSFTPDPWQKSLAQMMVDDGVDVIIGMHPHVLQEAKWVDRPDGKKTLLAYSIGNFISGMLGAQNMVGALLGFDIVKTTQNGGSSVSIENAQVIPVVTQYNLQRKGFQIYRFEDYTEDLAKQHGCIKSDPKFSYQYLKDLITKNIAPEFLSDFYK